jgi:hypothetical protein
MDARQEHSGMTSRICECIFFEDPEGRLRGKSFLLLVLSVLFCLYSVSNAFASGLEEDLQASLKEARSVAHAATAKLAGGSRIADEGASLRAIADDVRIIHLLLEERFKERSIGVEALGGPAPERHRAMEARYHQVVTDFLALIDALPADDALTPADLRSLLKLIDSILPTRQRPILGSLPYSHLNYPAREPVAAPLVVPAYRGGNRPAVDADTQGSTEAPITPEIVELAKSLDWNPIRIYEWVQENIETEWYWGSMKGAEETLRQRSGNDADQAALLISLLRSAGFPARYVRGVIEFFPGLEQAKRLTGLDDPLKIAAFLQKAGIPCEPIIAGGRIANFRIEHIWVETEVPYANYRGAVLDNMGKMWTPLDTHMKPPGYNWNTPEDFGAAFDPAALRNDYLSQPRTETPLEYLQNAFGSHLAGNFAAATYQDHLRTRTLIAEPLGLLPGSLQFNQLAITGEYTELPADLRHRVTFTAATLDGGEIFAITLDAANLSNRRVSLSYEPETVQDQRVINSYGGLGNTPSYLVRLRPVLKVDGERLVVGRAGLPMGADYTLTIRITSPNGQQEAPSHHIIGNLAVLGIVSQQVIQPTELPLEEKDAEGLLHEAALSYIDNWNRAEEELAAFLKVTIARPLPTVVTVGGVIDVDYLFDIPHGFEWKGVFIDAGLRRIETVTAPGQEERGREFMRLSSLQGSILENRLFEDAFGVASISTAKLLALAPQSLAPLLVLDPTNGENLLPLLDLPENVLEDIRNALHQGLTVTVPETATNYQNWNGIGYIKENPDTGEAGYMLSGMIAGGMTVWAPSQWQEATVELIRRYADMLQSPYSGEPNTNATAAYYIRKIAASDLQQGKVGEELPAQLQVQVLDKEMRPVQGVRVQFTMKAGGGTFTFNNGTTLSSRTDSNGISTATIKLGEKTADNPTFWRTDPDAYAEQVGEHIIDAALPNGTYVAEPFTAFAFPLEPHALRFTSGGGRTDSVLSWVGSATVIVEDAYQNPIANQPVVFNVTTTPQDSCAFPNQDTRSGGLVPSGSDCVWDIPTLGGACGEVEKPTQEEKTRSHGKAWVEVILGGTPNAEYRLVATSGSLAPQEVSYHTSTFGNCSGNREPEIDFELSSIHPTDGEGHNINAGRVGDTLPFKAKIHFLREGSTKTEAKVSYDCGEDDDSIACYRLIGNRSYYVDTDFIDPSVTFGDTEGEPQGQGVYVGNYVLKPGVNYIPVTGTAAVETYQINPDCGGDSCELRAREVSRSSTLYSKAYGVDITLDEGLFIVTDENWMAQQDQSIKFTISPEEYIAASTYVVIYSDNMAVAYLPGEKQGEGFVTVSRGFQFYPNRNYEYEVVLNYGSSVEIRSDRQPLHVGRLYIEKEDPDFPDIDLPWNDYYPPLGAKTITLKADRFDGAKVSCDALEATKSAIAGLSLNPKPAFTCEAASGGNQADYVVISGGGAKLRFSLPGVGPGDADNPSLGLDRLDLGISLEKDGRTAEDVIQLRYAIKNNANTTLQQVLDGEAVFVYDYPSETTSNPPQIPANHIGKTTGATDGERELDYVQMMIAHILPPLRDPVEEANLESLIDVNGIYGGQTKRAVAAIINGASDAAKIKDEGASATHGQTVIDTAVSHVREGAAGTFAKLVKDYSGLTAADVGKVIDKEVLVGAEKNAADKHPTSDPDVGIYELYVNDDWDGDGINNYIEVENEIDPITANSGYTDPNNEDMISIERGHYGHPGNGSNAAGQTTGLLNSGLRFPNSGKGYYYFSSWDPDDSDNYGPLRVVQAIEAVGRVWAERYPDLEPMRRNNFVDNRGYNVTNNLARNDDDRDGTADIPVPAYDNNPDSDAGRTEARIGINDLSRQGGGVFLRYVNRQLSMTTEDHDTHQNGLAADVRFVSRSKKEEGVDIRPVNSNNNNIVLNNFDKPKTIELMRLFLANGANRIVISQATGIEKAEFPANTIGFSASHDNHIHVEFPIVNRPLSIELEALDEQPNEEGNFRVRIDSWDQYGFRTVAFRATPTGGSISHRGGPFSAAANQIIEGARYEGTARTYSEDYELVVRPSQPGQPVTLTVLAYGNGNGNVTDTITLGEATGGNP